MLGRWMCLPGLLLRCEVGLIARLSGRWLWGEKSLDGREVAGLASYQFTSVASERVYVS